MDKLGKYLSLCLVVILVVSSILMIEPAIAESIPKPTVPEFMLQYRDYVDNQSIEVIIYDQLPAHYEVNGRIAFLFYNLRWKNHTENIWHVYSSDYAFSGLDFGNQLVSASNSYISSEPVSNDSIHYNTFTTNVTYVLGHPTDGLSIGNFSAGRQIDFQVKAFFGYYTLNNYKMNSYYFDYNESQWSNTQTVTIPITNNPGHSSTVPEFPITIVLVAVLSAASLLLVIGKKKPVLDSIEHKLQ